MKKLLLTILAIVTVSSVAYANTPFATFITSLTGKTTPVAADLLYLNDTAGGNVDKKLTFSNLESTLNSDSGTLTNKIINGASNTLTVRLANDVSGTLPFGNGGTGVSSASDDTTLVSSGSAWVASALPSCSTASSAITYNTGTNTFGCNTISGGGSSGGGTWSTTTSTVTNNLINYPNNTTDVVTIGASATTTSKMYFDPNINGSGYPNAYINGNLMIGNAAYGGLIDIDGLGTGLAKFQISDNINDIMKQVMINTSTGANALACNAYGNSRTTRAGVGSGYYGVVCFAGANYALAGFDGIKPNGMAIASSDGDLSIGSASTNAASSSIRFFAGRGFGASNQDAILTADTRGTNAALFGLGTTTPFGRLSISNMNGDFGGPMFVIGSSTQSATTTLFIVNNDGKTGVGTTTPGTVFSINNIANFDTSTSTFKSGINITSGCFALNGTCFSGSGGGSGSPFNSTTTFNAAVITTEYESNSTTSPIVINWGNGTQQNISLNTSAVTINMTNYVAGESLNLIVCNQNSGTTGTITWDTNIIWPSNINPGQTTTAKNCDLWSFIATTASSTASTGTTATKIFGNVTSSY